MPKEKSIPEFFPNNFRSKAPELWTVMWCDPAYIDPLLKQPRKYFDPVKIGLLASSIRSEGQKQLVPVRWKAAERRFEIADGERRWRAVRKAGKKLLVYVVPEADEKQKIMDAITSNLHRENLGVTETMNSVVWMWKVCELEPKQIANCIGKSQTTVENFLAIYEGTSKKVKDLMNPLKTKKILRFTSALALVKLKTLPDRQLAIAEDIIKYRMTLQQVRNTVERTLSNLGISDAHLGRRRKKPSDDLRALKTTLHYIGTKMIRFRRLGQVSFDKMFQNLPDNSEKELLIRVLEERLEDFESILKILRKIPDK